MTSAPRSIRSLNTTFATPFFPTVAASAWGHEKPHSPEFSQGAYSGRLALPVRTPEPRPHDVPVLMWSRWAARRSSRCHPSPVDCRAMGGYEIGDVRSAMSCRYHVRPARSPIHT